MDDVIVDTHVHVVSEDERAYPLQPSGITEAWYRDARCTVEELLGLMDAACVDRAVLVQGVSAYGFDNRYTTDSARRHGDRCTSVACVDLAADGAAGMARDLVEQDGARGIRWFLDPRPFDESRAFWASVAPLGVPAIVTTFADRLAELGTVLPELAPLPVALDHCGFPDFSQGVPKELAALASVPQVHLKVSTMTLDLLSVHGDVREGVADLVACFGADRLMWGSDWSQTHDRPYPELADYARDAATKLGDHDRAAFLGGTACSLWPELTP